MGYAFFAIFIMFCAGESWTEYEYFKKGQKGAYYEYDLAGTPKERAIREFAHHASQAIKRPSTGTYKFAKRSCHGFKRGRNMLEQYLRGNAANTEQQQRLAQGLSDWESIMQSAAKDRRGQSPQGILYLPYESWRLFKYSLYLVGFALPRALKKGAKNIVFNTFALNED